MSFIQGISVSLSPIPHFPNRGSDGTPASVPAISDGSGTPQCCIRSRRRCPGAAGPPHRDPPRSGDRAAPPVSEDRTAWCPLPAGPFPRWACRLQTHYVRNLSPVQFPPGRARSRTGGIPPG